MKILRTKYFTKHDVSTLSENSENLKYNFKITDVVFDLKTEMKIKYTKYLIHKT